MPELKDRWDLAMALKVLESKTVDAELWSEAAKWILLYGPPEIRELLQQASGMATNECFPELKPAGFADDGQLCFDLKSLASALGITEEEAGRKMMELEMEHGIRHLFDPTETHKIQ